MVHSQRGFTLVELSIVLVILGLLVGGVLTGQSLIRAAELRAVTTEYNRYLTAMQTFRDKYFALPGDMTNATSYWGAQDGAGGITNACKDSASSDAKTCNGDGNGIINYLTPTYSNEVFRFWQHLANAGLIEGSYNGITYLGGPSPCSTNELCSLLSTNSPRSRAGTAGWTVYGPGTVSSAPASNQWFLGNYGNSLFFGGVTYYTSAAALKPEEAYNIDTKLDDGKPGTGKVRSWNHTFHPNCADVDALTAVYQLNLSSIGCALIFDVN